MPNKRARTVNIDFLSEPDREGDLSDLFAGAVAEKYPITQISPARLQDNPYQPRVRLDLAGVTELATVIGSQGFQGVLVARPHPKENGAYQLAFGHRRREAAKLVGLEVLPVVVRPLGEEEMIELAIAENIQRQDLTALEEGRTFDMMVKVLGYTYEQIATAIGKTRGYIENRLRVAWAPRDVQDLVEAKPDSLRAVATLIKIEDSALRGEIIAQLLTGKLTADDLAGYIEASTLARQTGAMPDAATGGESVGVGRERGRRAVVARSASSDASPTEMDERTRLRTGFAQLSTALRATSKFQTGVATRDEISAREFIVLADLHKLVDQLYEQYSPPDITRVS